MIDSSLGVLNAIIDRVGGGGRHRDGQARRAFRAMHVEVGDFGRLKLGWQRRRGTHNR